MNPQEQDIYTKASRRKPVTPAASKRHFMARDLVDKARRVRNRIGVLLGLSLGVLSAILVLE